MYNLLPTCSSWGPGTIIQLTSHMLDTASSSLKHKYVTPESRVREYSLRNQSTYLHPLAQYTIVSNVLFESAVAYIIQMIEII